MTTGDSKYIDQSIEALDRAARAYMDFWSAFVSIHDDWSFSVPFNMVEWNSDKQALAVIGSHIDQIQARLLLEKHRAMQRSDSQRSDSRVSDGESEVGTPRACY